MADKDTPKPSNKTNQQARDAGLVFKPTYDEPDQKLPSDEQPDEIKVKEDELARDHDGEPTEDSPSVQPNDKVRKK